MNSLVRQNAVIKKISLIFLLYLDYCLYPVLGARSIAPTMAKEFTAATRLPSQFNHVFDSPTFELQLGPNSHLPRRGAYGVVMWVLSISCNHMDSD